MKKRSSFAGLLPVLLPLAAFSQEPTPTPRPAAAPAPVIIRPSRLASPPTPTPQEGAKGTDSLADVVRRSQEARSGEGGKRSLGVITNETLKQPASGPSSKGRTGTVNVIATPKGGSASAAPAPEFRDLQGHTEAEWRRRAIEARLHERKAEADVKKLEDDAKRLENDFYAWDDGNYRDRVIKPSWEKAKEDLKKSRLELDQAKAATADLEEEARKAGAPPGWLREK